MKTRPASILVALLALLCLCNSAHAAATLEITTPWIREAPPTSRVLAAYMSINNPGDAAVTINAISSPDFESAELHRTVINEGVASMQHIKQLEVPANGDIMLEPGGLHLMLFNPKRMLAAGDTVTLTIHVTNGTCMTVSAPVVRKVDDGHSQHHH